MFSDVVYDLKVDGDKVTGTALMARWPGLCPVSDGKIKGDHFSMTAIGEIWSSSGYPKMDFDGTIHGDEMTLTLTWSYVGGFADANTPKLAMEGKRIDRR
jgi:hypothetical protein